MTVSNNIYLQVEDLKKKCEVLRRTVSQKEDQINIQQNEISRLNQTLETFLSGRNKNYNESLVQELQQNLGRTEYLLAESTNARNQQDVIISSLKERVESLQSINTGAVLEKEDVQLRFNALNTESSQIKSSLQSCRKELEVCKTERTELQLRVENLSLDVQNFERKSENYYRLLTDANDKLTAKTLELNEAIRTINSLSADNSNEVISELQDSLHSCRSNVQRLQEENSRYEFASK